MKLTDLIKQVEANPYSAFFYTPLIYKKAISYLFLKPFEIISVYKKEDLDYAFKVVNKLIDKGYFGYSLINYEAGFLFESRLSKLLLNENKKLMQFFFFDKREAETFKSSKIIFGDFANDGYLISNFKLNRTEEQFKNDVKSIRHYIKEGDTYQVNYTIKGSFNFTGSYSAFFQKLLFNQSAMYSAFINNEDDFIISLSPELFFSQEGRKIISRPMKGTARRGFNHNSDNAAESDLRTSEKNQAENVMIVDLIRNDLGRVCRYGSITAPKLFKIEKYESLFQMVSRVEGKLRKKKKFADIVQSLFPCGSVTGAPKIRTMEIINEIEKEERGIYTGSIGIMTPDEIKMNVAIRTITISKKTNKGVMGLGSGIIWDSDPKSEFEEVKLKSNFLTKPEDYFEIFETMKFENGEIIFLDDHLERMKSAADYFLFRLNEKKLRKQVKKAIVDLDRKEIKKVRVSLNKWGIVKVEISAIPELPENISVIVSSNKIRSTDKFRHFKTTNRKMYDDDYAQYSSEGFYDILYINEKGELAEGSRTNIFLRKGSYWYTPPLDSGALPGICRKHFLKNYPETIGKKLVLDDLRTSDEIVLTNSVKGEVKVSQLFITPEEYISFKI
jgi:para-aminobenzoate synthetase/4-amino-4-deoxychorismate lyase